MLDPMTDNPHDLARSYARLARAGELTPEAEAVVLSTLATAYASLAVSDAVTALTAHLKATTAEDDADEDVPPPCLARDEHTAGVLCPVCRRKPLFSAGDVQASVERTLAKLSQQRLTADALLRTRLDGDGIPGTYDVGEQWEPNVPEYAVRRWPVHFPTLLVDIGWAENRAQASRLIAAGVIAVDYAPSHNRPSGRVTWGGAVDYGILNGATLRYAGIGATRRIVTEQPDATGSVTG